MRHLLVLLLLASSLSAQNLCPNPSAEEGDGDKPAGWITEGGSAIRANDQAHSGQYSFKLVNNTPGVTLGWLSPIIPVKDPTQQFVLTAWSKLEKVTGEGGSYIVIYHMNEKGERIGQSGSLPIGGIGQEVATTDWQQHLTISALTPETKGVRVNVRLYGATGTAWFDDIDLQLHETKPLTTPRPLRQGLRLDQLAIVSADGAEEAAKTLQQALRERGHEVPILAHDQVNLATEQRDLIILGNLATSRAAEYLYLRSYTIEDVGFPGKGGYVLRPLVNPLGTGANLTVVGASDEAGLAAGAKVLAEKLGTAAEVPLTVSSTTGFKRLGSGWLETGAIDYLTTGNLDHARKFRDVMLQKASVPDDQLFNADNSIHLFAAREMLAWGLMESCGVFSDEERLKVTQYLLKIARSDQGYGYSGLRGGLTSRENHGTRAARGFYYMWRYFSKYHGDDLGLEMSLWRGKLQDFWTVCFASSRTFEDSLSQHALGGSMVNILDIGFQEPEWSAEFFNSGRARQMAERCTVIVDNMGQTVLLGDTSAGDYPGSVFAMLAYKLHDPRYTFMLAQRGTLGFSSDEPLRNFDLGLTPELPADHLGLKIIPSDLIFFNTGIQRHEGVTPEESFDKLSLRSGFGPEDEYLMLDGTAGGSHSYDDANTIGEFSANGRRWLCEIDIFNGPTMSFHNAVTVAREGLGDPNVPQAAEVVTTAQGDGYAYTATRLPQYNQTDWTRHLLWLPGQYTVVMDELIALEPGDYSFVLGWRSLGNPTLKPGLFESTQDERKKTGLAFTGQQMVPAVTANSGKVLYHMGNYDSLFYRADTEGDFVEVALKVPARATYDLVVRTLQYTGRGTVQLSIDGKPVGKPMDVYLGGEPTFADNELGKVTLDEGEHRFRFTVTGKKAESSAYTFAIGEIALYRGAERQEAHVSPNRFRLVFPADVPATLDRDTETLGKYLPTSPHHERVLNIVEQSQSRALKSGESACFQNVFYGAKDGNAGRLEMRRLDDHALLVKNGNEVALIGTGVTGAAFRTGPLQASGKLFYLSPQRVILHEATATFAGKPLTGPNPALAACLKAAWEVAPKPTTASGGGAAAPRLQARWQADLSAAPLSVAAYAPAGGARLVVGQENGAVAQFDAAGKPTGEFQTQGPVHALLGCDLDADKAQELLVGSDDEHLYALRPDLTELWNHRVDFLRDEQPWDWWTLGSAKVRQLYADDITGDGKPEILMGNGNMRLLCFDTAGQLQWRFRTDHGICTTITTADVFGEGKRRVLAGNGLTSDQGTCWVLDESGKQIQTYFNGGWCTALPAIAVGDLDGDGKPTIFCGNNRGDLRAYPAERGSVNPLWIRNLTRPIRSLTVLPGLLVAGADSGYLCAFNQAGNKAWGLPLSSAITHTALLTRAGGPVLAAGCKDGQVFLVSPEGKRLGSYPAGGRLQDLTVADLDGDGSQELVIVTATPNRVYVLVEK